MVILWKIRGKIVRTVTSLDFNEERDDGVAVA